MRYKKKKYYQKRKKYSRQNEISQGEAIAGLLFVPIFGGYYYFKDLYNENIIKFYLFIGIFILLVIGYLYLLIKIKKDKDKKYMNIKTIEDMKKLHWREFEKFIAFVFKQKGFKAITRKGTHDGGIDINAELNGQKYFIQCKKWNNYTVGRPDIQKFYGAVMGENKESLGIYVTTSRLTSDAQVFAHENNIEIWDDSNLEKYIGEFTSNNTLLNQEILNKDIENIICNKCGSNMVKRIAKNGIHKGENFYGCSNYPICKNIQN